MGFINSSKGTNSLFVGNIVHHLCSFLPMSHTSTLPAFFNHYFLPTGCMCWINWGKIWFSTLQIGKIKETIKIKNKNTKDGDALQKNTIFAHENQGSILSIAVAIRGGSVAYNIMLKTINTVGKRLQLVYTYW